MFLLGKYYRTVPVSVQLRIPRFDNRDEKLLTIFVTAVRIWTAVKNKNNFLKLAILYNYGWK